MQDCTYTQGDIFHLKKQDFVVVVYNIESFNSNSWPLTGVLQIILLEFEYNTFKFEIKYKNPHEDIYDYAWAKYIDKSFIKSSKPVCFRKKY